MEKQRCIAIIWNCIFCPLIPIHKIKRIKRYLKKVMKKKFFQESVACDSAMWQYTCKTIYPHVLCNNSSFHTNNTEQWGYSYWLKKEHWVSSIHWLVDYVVKYNQQSLLIVHAENRKIIIMHNKKNTCIYIYVCIFIHGTFFWEVCRCSKKIV